MPGYPGRSWEGSEYCRNRLSLEVKEAIIEGAQSLLETCVGLEPLLLVPENGVTIIREFQTLLIIMMESYEQQLRLEAPRISKGVGWQAFEIPEAQLRFFLITISRLVK